VCGSPSSAEVPKPRSPMCKIGDGATARRKDLGDASR